VRLLLRRLYAATIWHPAAIGPLEQKYRSLKRVWLPLYDTVAILAGITAAVYGSRLLDRLYGDFTDAIGVFFALVATVCLTGVVFPRLWAVEFVGKSVLVGMIIAYATAIVVSPSPEQLAAQEAPSWFITVMLLLPLPLPMFRLELLTTEWADRRAVDRRRALGGPRD
jgi:hypothetical protein